ncbi:cell division protein ZapE [Gammaproteobacteria bacterium]|nr:cell division protein ZapE [Gammaproteobacteria bacterium]
MKDIKVVIENLSTQGIALDNAQASFLEEFISIDSTLKPKLFFSKNNLIGNLYLYGPVGRGKTMLLQALNDCYFSNSGKFHFIEFMQLVHKKLSDFSGNSDPLLMVVKSLSKDYKIIFLDEFQIEDIADAMIIGTLIESLTNKGTRLMITSNSHPDDLYKNGLQRAKFIKTINFINDNFFIHHLIGAEDYRLREIAHFDSSANDRNSDKSVRDFLQRTFNSEFINITEFTVSNRAFDCLGCSDKILWLSFDDFFSSPCASKDFIEIVKTFEWVFINNFHSCTDDHLDKLRRFISFIDIAYQEKQKLKFFYDPNLINTLYSGNQLLHLWARTESRLHQITTTKYLQNLEKNLTK